jgi:hypothetical protein
MTKVIQTLLAIVMSVNCSLSLYAQAIPTDSLYLGQTPPGNTPKIFKLAVASKSFAAERIAISKDGRYIYYQELDGYTELDGKPHTGRCKYYNYSNGKWNGPLTFMEDYGAPAFSTTGDTMYIQTRNWQAYYSVKSNSGWGTPIKFSTTMKYSHYLQGTNSGHYYVSSNPANSVGGLDRSRIYIDGSDTTVASLEIPLNSAGHDFDFLISRDESFMIVAMNNDLCISYQKNEGGWTNPKNLGKAINFGLAAWGPTVTEDNTYLFYTTGTNPDYSDVYIYWVRVCNLIDSLKTTNYKPYLKKQIQNQTAKVHNAFAFSLVDNTFIDDDGNTSLKYSASLGDNRPLPTWLHFNSANHSFSGTPSETGSIKIKVTVTDSAKAFVSGEFEIRTIE